MKLSKKLLTSPLLLSSIFLIVLSIPHFYQRYFDRDEGMYAAITTSMFNGSTLYRDVWDHKPPLIFFIYSPVALYGTSTGIFILRFLAIILKIVNLYFFYRILSKFNIKQSFHLPILLLMSFLLASPIFHGNTINAEVFYLPITTLFVFRILNKNLSYFEGILLFLALITKFQAFAEMSAFLCIFLLLNYLKSRKIQTTSIARILITFGSLVLGLIGIAFFSDNLKELIFSTITANFGYVDQRNYLINIGDISIGRNLFIIGIFVILTLALYYQYFFKNKAFLKISERTFLILNLFLVESFLVLYPQRNYAHYLLQLLPTILFSIIFVIYFFDKFTNYKIRFLAMTFVLVIPVLFINIFTITDFKIVKPMTGFPFVTYYNKFLSEDLQSSESVYFSSDNINENTAQYLKLNYSKDINYYFYGSEPWVINLSGLPFINKYVYFLQMYYSEQMYIEEKKIMLSANVIILDSNSAIRATLKQEIEDNYLLKERYRNYAIYIKK